MPCNTWISLSRIIPFFLLLIFATRTASGELKEGHSYTEEPNRKLCIGTDDGMNIIQLPNITHYDRLMKSFVSCKRIFGNLEITHITPEDLETDFDTDRLPSGEVVRKQRTPFWFLSQLEEITGYLLIFNVNIPRFTLPNLKIIWGGKLHAGQGLEINYCDQLQVLTINSGRIKVEASPNLCFMQTKVDYSELLGSNQQSRVLINPRQFSYTCPQQAQCHKQCGRNPCYGPEAGDCQVVYRRNCKHCSSGTCYTDVHGFPHCCDDACTGGCYGDGEDKCVACKHFEEDGRCVRSCRGNSEYNATAMVRESIPEDRKRYYYEKHCVKECPPGMLIEEDRFCVSRCSEKHYRDHAHDERRCIPCNGTCPKICVMDTKIDYYTIKKLVNCSEIDGYIELLNHVFEPHTPDDGDPTVTIPALTAQELNVLKSVRVITGYVIIDGGNRSNAYTRPRSLDFLENLEIIEGRELYHKKYAMYVVGSNDLHSLGLRSMRKIRNGVIGFRQNPNLCYGREIPFKQRYGVNATWVNNMPEQQCEKLGRTCDSTCHPQMGCWGPGPAQCILCRNFKKDGICAARCPIHDGYYIPVDQNNDTNTERRCEPCSEKCTECYGPNADQCNKCRFFEYRPAGQNTMKCVRTCPRDTFAHDNKCIRCQPAYCRCTGNSTMLGQGGCNSCLYAVEHRKDQIECLAGLSDDICAENNLTNYHLTLAPPETRQQYRFMCLNEDIAALVARQRKVTIAVVIVIFITIVILIAYLTYRCMKYRKKYEKEAQMHLPEIPALDPRKGKWKPPGRNSSIPVAIKAINPSETKHVTDAEMMKEAGIMGSVEHEHLLPLVGVCIAKGGLKIVTILRPLGSLLKFLGEHKASLGAKQMIVYCYQISSVTDFGLAQMLQGSWLIDPESRPTFSELKRRFETFCRAPQIFIQDRQAAQHMDSISDSDQVAMIQRLLQDSDFVDPMQLQPEDYREPGRINIIRSSNLTDTTFLPDTPTTANFPDNPLNGNRANSSNSSRYKSDPTAGQQLLEEMEMDEDNYLTPKSAPTREEEQGLVYTPVVGMEKETPKNSPAHEYSNDPNHRLLYADSEDPKDPPTQQYVNQQVETAF
ncbi:EGF receptor and Furin cysteine rich region and Tyrosine protein kinase domain containing protein [Aphelenchoides besseyi]|nr:EGF receptor and Furin cysteine rich region and Tyrosine protein kinase domain containing protein [Aphelenchoides besseyi]